MMAWCDARWRKPCRRSKYSSFHCDRSYRGSPSRAFPGPVRLNGMTKSGDSGLQVEYGFSAVCSSRKGVNSRLSSRVDRLMSTFSFPAAGSNTIAVPSCPSEERRTSTPSASASPASNRTINSSSGAGSTRRVLSLASESPRGTVITPDHPEARSASTPRRSRIQSKKMRRPLSSNSVRAPPS